jgi:amino acid transporter
MNVVPTMLYIIMYFLMFAAGVRLRYTHPKVPRRYRVPFGNVGMWLLAIVGSLAGLVGIVFAFMPPANVPDRMKPSYISVVLLGFVIFTAMPFAIYALRKPEWRATETTED